MPKRTRTLFLTLIGLLIIAGISYGVYHVHLNQKYPIPNEKAAISKHLSNWMMRGEQHQTQKWELLALKHLGNSDTYVAQIKNITGEAGTATLKEGGNRQLRVKEAGYGDGLVRYTAMKTSDGIYGVVSGLNPHQKIKTIRVNLQSDPYHFTVQVPKGEHFLITQKLPHGVSDSIAVHMHYYDDGYKEIWPKTETE